MIFERDIVLRRGGSAYTLVELMVAVAVIGVVLVTFYLALSIGFKMMQHTRENLRATQILVQRAETIRLFNWSQVTSNNYIEPNFMEYYNPFNPTNKGVAFYGTNYPVIPASYPSAYKNNMRLWTITVRWTNYNGSIPIPHTRTMQTYVARYGMQSYIYGR